MPVPTDWRNRIVNAQAGASKSSLFPNTCHVRLLDGNPDDSEDPGAEITGGGYARIGPIDMTSGTMWPAAEDGSKANAVAIEGTTSTGAYDEVATWAQVVEGATGTPTAYGPTWQLADEIDIDAAGQRPVIPVGGIVISELDIETDLLDEE